MQHVLVTAVGYDKNQSEIIVLKMAIPIARLANTTHTGTKTDTDDIFSRTCGEIESL